LDTSTACDELSLQADPDRRGSIPAAAFAVLAQMVATTVR
jgi:hypothetical protein